MSVEEVLVRFPPLAVLIEYDATLILAGMVAHLGLIAFPTAVAAGGVGALLGHSVFFALGRHGAAAVRGSSTYARVASFVDKVATWSRHIDRPAGELSGSELIRPWYRTCDRVVGGKVRRWH